MRRMSPEERARRKQEREDAIKKYDNGELLKLMKTHVVVISPSWSKYYWDIRKIDVRHRSSREKIEFYTVVQKTGRKIIVLRE